MIIDRKQSHYQSGISAPYSLAIPHIFEFDKTPSQRRDGLPNGRRPRPCGRGNCKTLFDAYVYSKMNINWYKVGYWNRAWLLLG